MDHASTLWFNSVTPVSQRFAVVAKLQVHHAEGNGRREPRTGQSSGILLTSLFAFLRLPVRTQSSTLGVAQGGVPLGFPGVSQLAHGGLDVLSFDAFLAEAKLHHPRRHSPIRERTRGDLCKATVVEGARGQKLSDNRVNGRLPLAPVRAIFAGVAGQDPTQVAGRPAVASDVVLRDVAQGLGGERGRRTARAGLVGVKHGAMVARGRWEDKAKREAPRAEIERIDRPAADRQTETQRRRGRVMRTGERQRRSWWILALLVGCGTPLASAPTDPPEDVQSADVQVVAPDGETAVDAALGDAPVGDQAGGGDTQPSDQWSGPDQGDIQDIDQLSVPDTADAVATDLGDVAEDADVLPADTQDAADVEPDADPCQWTKCANLGPCISNTCEWGACIKKPAAGPCDDGNLCTTADSCNGGNCLPGAVPLACSDGNACTADTCDPIQGCNSQAILGNCDDSDPCTSDLCVTGTGACEHQPLDGGVCTDGDACTSGDLCKAGQCKGDSLTCGANATCADPVGCTCNPGYVGDGQACTPGLTALSVSAGTLWPALAPQTTGYLVAAAFTDASVAITAAAVDGAPMTLGGVPLVQGVASSPVLLPIGVTELVLVVGTAPLTTTYTLTLARGAQTAYLKAPVPGKGDEFAHAVAVSGDTAVVGAPQESACAGPITAGCYEGAAHVYVRSGNAWLWQASLKAATPHAGDKFGAAVAIDGDTVLVGAPGDTACGITPTDTSCANAGAVHHFVRQNGKWSAGAVWKASAPAAGDQFGAAVAVAFGRAAVGAPGHGHVHLWSEAGGVWTSQSPLATPGAAGDGYGTALAIAKDRLAVGAPSHAGCPGPSAQACVDAGAAYVYALVGQTWNLSATLQPVNAVNGDLFGSAVALAGTTLAVGAPGQSDCATTGSVGGCTSAGAVYLFEESGTWSQTSWKKPATTSAYMALGSSLALDGDVLIAGAPFDSQCPGSPAVCANAGSAYVFTRSGPNWSEFAALHAENYGTLAWYGMAVGVSGSTLIVGARGEASCSAASPSSTGCKQAGAAYIME